MRVLIVEDERRLADALGQLMREQRYITDVVYDGRDGLAYAASGQYDVVVLDVMLPLLNGYEIVRQLREQRVATPVLLLTARDDVANKVQGLDCGADDYMTKPFSPEELTARVRALTRRQGDVVLETLVYGDLLLRLPSNELCCKGRTLHLGFKEFEVMRVLISNPTRIVSKDELLRKVWGADSDAVDNNVEAYVSFLRKKLSYLDSGVNICTVRKVGYRLENE